MIGMMVTVDSVEHLHAHAEKAGGLPSLEEVDRHTQAPH